MDHLQHVAMFLLLYLVPVCCIVDDCLCLVTFVFGLVWFGFVRRRKEGRKGGRKEERNE